MKYQTTYESCKEILNDKGVCRIGKYYIERSTQSDVYRLCNCERYTHTIAYDSLENIIEWVMEQLK